MAQLVKTMAGLAIASVKTVNGLAIASVKTVAGLDNTSGGGCNTLRDFQDGLIDNNVFAEPPVVGYGSSFVAGATTTICRGTLSLWKATGTPDGNLVFSIFTNNAGVPGTLVGSAATPVAASTVTATSQGTQTVDFPGISASITNGTTYWITLIRTGATTGELAIDRSTEAGQNIAINDGSWTGNYQTDAQFIFELFSS